MNSEGTKSTPAATQETLEVTLFTRAGCHLCEEAKSQMAPLLLEFGARLREVDIDADPQLRELYNVDVPVIFLAGRMVAKHRVDLKQFKRQLQEAQKAHSRPRSRWL